MFNIIVEDFKKTTGKYVPGMKKIPWILANHAFSFVVIFVLMGAIVSGAIFYKYIFIFQMQESKITETPQGTFQEKTYQAVLKSWEMRRQIIENSQKGNYNNPF